MNEQLLPCLLRLAQVQGEAVDRLALQACLQSVLDEGASQAQPLLAQLLHRMQLHSAQWMHADRLQATQVPALAFEPGQGWSVLRGRNAQGHWIIETFDSLQGRWKETSRIDVATMLFARMALAKPYRASNSPVFNLIKDTVFQRKDLMLEIALSGSIINAIAMASSLYSMQVYDRVVPTGATQTLLALTLGVLGALVFELIAKFTKSGLTEKLADEVDSQLARMVYSRFLAVRMDQMPTSVGGLAGQLKGYETVRAFLSAVPPQLAIDLPFLLVYGLIVVLIGGWIGLIPMAFMVVSLVVGLTYRRRVEALTRQANNASNLKTGLLVETIEGAETIKSGQGGWRMLTRWLQTTDQARETELEMRQVSEHAQYWITTLHQLSYILMVAGGALIVARGEMSMGALIACTILSGRILGPIGTFPNLLIQWGHCKAALQGLDRIWALQDDHHGIDQPIVLEQVQGHYQFEGVEASYGSNNALKVPQLNIRPGEKIAVLGPIGAGKTTLLRLLSGMYKPQKGSIKLDGVDLSYISKPVLAEQIGFLQQEGRLFAGTLRDNLVLGLIDPGDQALLDIAKLTGLHASVVAAHPQGLQQIITEGGLGLSGGQKQLTNLTRVFLRKPRIWLLDEPTASLDRTLEVSVIQALARTLQPQDTLVLVTHKTEMLSLVDRVIVVANHQILVDGPRDDVLRQLQQNQASLANAKKDGA
jgi:ATP-binding cassette subfamily C protein LapB